MNNYLLIIFALFITSCSFNNKNTSFVEPKKNTITKNMIINGWVTSKKYWPTYNASLIVTVYMKLENKYLPVSKQEFSSRLPIRFSANLAPIQSGTGSLVVATQLKIKGKTVAIAREIIEYQSGEFEVNLPLTEL